MKTIIKFGLATLAMGTFFGVGLPVKAGELVWVRAQSIDFSRARGLMPPGSYSHNENQKPATIAVNKAGQGVGEQKQTALKAAGIGEQKQTISKLGKRTRIRQPT